MSGHPRHNPPASRQRPPLAKSATTGGKKQDDTAEGIGLKEYDQIDVKLRISGLKASQWSSETLCGQKCHVDLNTKFL